MNTLFEYQYRDAANFKAHGSVVLKGALTYDEIETVRSLLSGDGLFIAEQLNIPPLYEHLYQWSGGPTSSDHCWHEFVGIRLIDETESHFEPIWGEADEFVVRLLTIDEWDEEFSPHFRLSVDNDLF
jgi:hypothetical protein